RKHDRRGEHPLVEQATGERLRRGLVAGDHRGDGRLGGAGIEPERAKAVLEPAGVRPQSLEAVGLVLDDGERLDTGRDDRRWRARGEKVRPAAVLEPFDQLVVTGDESA